MEHLSNFGYAMIGMQANPTTPVTPDTGLPLYSETLATALNMDEDNRIAGHKMARHSYIMGQRTHTGDITFLGEPNTAGLVANILLTKGSTTGDDPYTHPFGLSGSQNPDYATLDVAKGDIVYRYWGVIARTLGPTFDANKMVLNSSLSALGVFSVATTESVSDDTLTLETTYNSTPTKGLVADDVVRITKAGGGVVDTTVSSVTDTTVTVASATGVTAGDTIHLRKQTLVDTLLFPFLWARTEFRFADTAANALSATHTPVEPDSGNWTITHNVANEGGEMRSGSFGPAGFARTTGDAEITTRQFFDTPAEEAEFMQMTRGALVVRHFSGDNHELRLTLNSIVRREQTQPLNAGEIIYRETTWGVEYDETDTQGFDLKVINGLSSI